MFLLGNMPLCWVFPLFVALCTVVILLAVTAPSLAQDSGGSNLASPCPGVFGYAPPWPESGFWVGVVTLSTEYLLHSLWLEIVLDSPAQDFGQLWHWVGNTTTQDNIQFRIENDDLQIQPDHPMTVRFFVRYDPLNTAPKLRMLRLNGKVICNVEPQQRVVENRPVFILSEKPLQPPQSNNPVSQRTINNSSAVFKPEIRYSNNPATSESVGCGVGLSGKITLSKDMTYMRGEIPWLVAIYKRETNSLRFICVGTLVTNRHVVTVANCIQFRTQETAVRDFVIKVGVHDVNDWTEEVATRKLVSVSVHEGYDSKTLQNNILILTLNQRVPFNDFIRPACLWSDDTELERIVGASGLIAGWGIRSPGHTEFHDVPYALRVPIVSTSQCRTSKPEFYNVTTSNTTLCAGDRNGVGPCIGDSGAGLYLLDGGRWRLRGLVSLSLRTDDGDCNLNEYVVYTDTAQYLPWIRNILSQKYID